MENNQWSTFGGSNGRRAGEMSGLGEFLSGRPWSVTEVSDLRHGLQIGVSLEIIADFFRRDVEEVRRKGVELGLLPKHKRLSAAAFD